MPAPNMVAALAPASFRFTTVETPQAKYFNGDIQERVFAGTGKVFHGVPLALAGIWVFAQGNRVLLVILN